MACGYGIMNYQLVIQMSVALSGEAGYKIIATSSESPGIAGE